MTRPYKKEHSNADTVAMLIQAREQRDELLKLAKRVRAVHRIQGKFGPLEEALEAAIIKAEGGA